MKIYKIILIIVEVFAVMAIMGFVIPKEGVNVGDVNMEFPTLAELVEKKSVIDDDATEKNIEQIREYIAEQQLNEEQKRRYEVIKYQYGINFPNDSVEWIFPLFDKLINAQNKPVRIMHYGDSQLEVDHITSELRDFMQTNFGGYGVGLLPAIQTVPTSAISQSCSAELSRYMVFAPNMHKEDRMYGPMGQVTQLIGSAIFTFRKLNLPSTKSGTKKFSQITVLLDNIGENGISAQLKTASGTTTYQAKSGDNFFNIKLNNNCNEAILTLSGNALIYGFLLDGNKGVQVDNAAMRGCSGTIFTSIASQSIKPYYKKYDVPLIIMQYGGNTMPYIKSEKAIETYCQNLQKQIVYLKKISPKSKILFIGPSDMATKVNGVMTTYPLLEQLVDSIKQMCADNDVAYWDLYRAMGGKDSMVKWVKATPAYAGADYVHFTNKGSSLASYMLCNGFAVAYNFYLYSNPNLQNREEITLYEIPEFE